jgi:hypothetical protein
MEKFTDYIANFKKEYVYTLKFAVNEMTDSTIDCLINSLQKYGLKTAATFKETPIQESPLDFPNVKHSKVFISEITLDYPASHDMLRTLISNSTGITEGSVAVYGKNDPRQIETDLFLERSSKEYKEKYQTVLGNLPPDQQDVPYGENYNTGFLKELEKVSKERKAAVIENPLSSTEKTDHSTLPKGYNDKPTEDVQSLFGKIKLPPKPSLKKA